MKHNLIQSPGLLFCGIDSSNVCVLSEEQSRRHDAKEHKAGRAPTRGGRAGAAPAGEDAGRWTGAQNPRGSRQPVFDEGANAFRWGRESFQQMEPR